MRRFSILLVSWLSCSRIIPFILQAKFPIGISLDPVALGIPSYFDVIRQPMDLSTIQEKINQGLYDDVQGVHADVKLMLKNCLMFNPPGTPVNLCGLQVEKIWKDKWRVIQSVQDEPEEEDSQTAQGECSSHQRYLHVPGADVVFSLEQCPPRSSNWKDNAQISTHV